MDAYETITKEGSWTSQNRVTYTEAVGKPDGSFRKMSDAEAEEALAKAKPGSNEYYFAEAELKGKDYVEYDTVDKKVYYDPYEYAEAMKPRIAESIAITNAGDSTIYSEEDIKELLGDEAAKELFGI